MVKLAWIYKNGRFIYLLKNLAFYIGSSTTNIKVLHKTLQVCLDTSFRRKIAHWNLARFILGNEWVSQNRRTQINHFIELKRSQIERFIWRRDSPKNAEVLGIKWECWESNRNQIQMQAFFLSISPFNWGLHAQTRLSLSLTYSVFVHSLLSSLIIFSSSF